MSNTLDEVSVLIHRAVERLSSSRRTFTEREALEEVWNAGYDVAIQSDPRFVLAQEDARHDSHWRLDTHMFANTLLLNELLSGQWDGRDLDEKLLSLGEADQQHYVYCPLDPRLTLNKQGVLEPAEHERTIPVPRSMKIALDTLGSQLLARWQEGEPWTLRTITDMLQQLGWSDAEKHNAQLYVRSWLLGWPVVQRVGQDYWLPRDKMPQEVGRTHLQVMPVRMYEVNGTVDEHVGEDPSSTTRPETTNVQRDERQAVLSGEATKVHAVWSVRLRTINLLEGFLHVPAHVRAAYPLSAPGENEKAVLRGVWFEDNTRFWLWLDRTHQRLYGPALAEKLAWQEAGDIVRVEWASDVVVMRLVGHDEKVKREEARLIDLEALSTLRGGIGESYRRSLQAILLEHPQGLPFAEVVHALRKRQNHEVHRGTIHALLHSGGFVQRDGHWYAAPDSEASARQLRAAFVETLVAEQQDEMILPLSPTEHTRTQISAIHTRLSEITTTLRHKL